MYFLKTPTSLEYFFNYFTHFLNAEMLGRENSKRFEDVSLSVNPNSYGMSLMFFLLIFLRNKSFNSTNLKNL